MFNSLAVQLAYIPAESSKLFFPYPLESRGFRGIPVIHAESTIISKVTWPALSRAAQLSEFNHPQLPGNLGRGSC